MTKNYTPDYMRAGRIIRHGMIEDLSDGFNLKGTPFTIFLAPKSVTEDSYVIMDVKLNADEEHSTIPILVGDWNPLLITEIEPDNSILSDYDIYWGTGTDNVNIK